MFSVGGASTTSSTKFHAGENLEADEKDSFGLYIVSIHSHLEGTNVDSFHNKQEEMIHLDTQPSQEQHTVVDFGPANIKEFTPVISDAS